MATEKPYVIGLDLGGTNSVFGIVDANAKVVEIGKIKTGAYETFEEWLDASIECLKPMIEKVGGIDKIKAMGAGAPNGNYYSGCIEFAPNLKWGKGTVPFAKSFEERLGIPCYLSNDANCAALGEMKYGAARGMKNFIVITLGTGVGSGIVVNGEMVYGCDGFAGELGHVIAERDGRPCGCGFKGCLETYCSATGVARTAREILANTDEPSLLREKDPATIESLDVSIAAGKGDKVAKEIFEFTGNMLGRTLADFTKFSSPEAYIFFGGLVKAGDLIMDPIKKAYDENCMPIFKLKKAKFMVSELPDADAAVLGASALAW